jgi:hypothetical protein
MPTLDFPPRPAGSPFESAEFSAWLDKLRLAQNLDNYIALTAPATGDELWIFDVSAGASRKITLANLLTITLNALWDISGASGGQIKFPATQNPASNVNTLDDYEEGTWTPALTFATPGDLSVAYTTQVGAYTKIGNAVIAQFTIVTSSFTFTTASGNLTITGLPFSSINTTGQNYANAMRWSGITKAGYTSGVSFLTPGSSSLLMRMDGSGVAEALVTAADTPTGGSVILGGTLVYFTA